MSLSLESITPRPNDAVEFLSHWFDQVDRDSLISVVWIHPTKLKTDSIVLPLSHVIGALRTEGMDQLIWSDNTQYDLYYSVATNKEVPTTKGKRGGNKNVRAVPGLWIDFDVKEGCFESEEEILAFVETLDIAPSHLVGTGSGGVHGYWKMEEPLNFEEAQEMALRWLFYVREHAGDRKIDKLCDPARLMRLPGAIRWPKKADQMPGPVTILEMNDNLLSMERALMVTEQAWAAHLAEVKGTRDRVSRKRLEAVDLLESTDNKWLRLMKVANIEEFFNERYDWESILDPAGWENLGKDEDGRVIWSRPGGGGRKSATTDWEESPHVMSLFSTAPETGLLQLLEANIVLTKYRVWVELYWNGDETAAINSLV